MRRLATIFVSCFVFASLGGGAGESIAKPEYRSSASIEDFLRTFHANPAKEMDRLPDHVSSDGNLIHRGYINRDVVEARLPSRIDARDAIMGITNFHYIGIEEGSPDGRDTAERLVEGGSAIKNIQEIENRGLSRAALPEIPWTDSYWPMYKGVLGNRYADPRFPKSKDWMANYSYTRSNPASVIIASGDASAIDRLSPSEKYDFVMGDMDFTLTQFSWLQGEKHYERYGRVAGWMGICHGWAATAHMLTPIPDHPVTVIGATGMPVKFYPQDIKALKSMLWANASPKTRFVGNRCYMSSPPKNSNGRIMDPNCFDSNPGTWHAAVTNQMGIHGRSFVIDSTYDAEVWNFPLSSYQYRYFNPETWKEGTSVRASMIPIERYRVDKFRQYRSPKARYVVGVFMDATHVGAIAPTRGKVSKPPLTTVRFVYDLELDADLNIIGGEWYSNAHPDFLWTFDSDAQAMTGADSNTLRDPWTPESAVPTHWGSAAKRASNRGAPLYSFVRWLGSPPVPGEGESPVDPERDGGTGGEGESE